MSGARRNKKREIEALYPIEIEVVK